MNPRVIRRRKTPAANYISSLSHSIGCQIYRRADRIAWTVRSTNQLYAEPVPDPFRTVEQKRGWAIHLVDYNAHTAVVEQIPYGRATARQHFREPGSLHGRDDAQFASVVVEK